MNYAKIIEILALVFLLLFALAGCTTMSQPQPIQTKVQYAYYEIPSVLLDCDTKEVTVPKADTLVDSQVTSYGTDVDNLLNECQNDVRSIRKLQAGVLNKMAELNK